MINPEVADNKAVLWTYSRMMEKTELYAGKVKIKETDNLGMVIGEVEEIYYSPMALNDIWLIVGWN